MKVRFRLRIFNNNQTKFFKTEFLKISLAKNNTLYFKIANNFWFSNSWRIVLANISKHIEHNWEKRAINSRTQFTQGNINSTKGV